MNVRAEMYFNLCTTIRRGLYVDGHDLSPELKQQLCAIRWLTSTNGRLLLTPKEELRTQLNMSPDIADALALTCLDLWKGDDPVMNSNRGSNGLSREEEEEIMSEY